MATKNIEQAFFLVVERVHEAPADAAHALVVVRRDPGPLLVAESGVGKLAHRHAHEERDASAPGRRAAGEGNPVVHAVARLVCVERGRLRVAPFEDIVDQVAVGVDGALDVVHSGDGRERGLGAGDGVKEAEIGGLVGGDEPAVRRADGGVAGERGQKRGGLGRNHR